MKPTQDEGAGEGKARSTRGHGQCICCQRTPMKLALKDGAVRFEVHAKPRAKKSKVVGERGDAVEIALAAPPVDGAANEELVRFVAKVLRSPPARHRAGPRREPRAKSYSLSRASRSRRSSRALRAAFSDLSHASRGTLGAGKWPCLPQVRGPRQRLRPDRVRARRRRLAGARASALRSSLRRRRAMGSSSFFLRPRAVRRHA